MKHSMGLANKDNQISKSDLTGDKHIRARLENMCHGQSRVFFGMVIPLFNRNPYNGYINPYYWVDDHPLLYGNNGSLDPGTYDIF